MRLHTLTVGEQVSSGAREHPGKPEWSDAVVLELDRASLLRLLREVAGCIEQADAGEVVEITLHGALKAGEP